MLAAGHPDRVSDEALAQELRDAIPYDMRESHGSADDLAHGRQLILRRWMRRGSAALVAVVLIVVAGAVLIPTRPPVPQAAPVAADPHCAQSELRAIESDVPGADLVQVAVQDDRGRSVPSGSDRRVFQRIRLLLRQPLQHPKLLVRRGRCTRLPDVPARQGRHGGLPAGRDEPQVRRTLRRHHPPRMLWVSGPWMAIHI